MNVATSEKERAMELIVFEDEWVEQLYPITIGRPTYAVSCASYRLVDWLLRLNDSPHSIVRPHLAKLQREDFSQLKPFTNASGRAALWVNARLVPSASAFAALKSLVQSAEPVAVWQGDQLTAAVTSAGAAGSASSSSAVEPSSLWRRFGLDTLPRRELPLSLFEYPHDVVRHNMAAMAENLEARLASGDYREIRDGVFAAEGATLGDYIVSDTSHGPILLDRSSRVGPYCYLSGPAYLGVGSRVIEHAAIKDAVSIGHTAKIGGEVEASVIEPFTNKQHHGFLGHSYLGSWINLGAGTCNSDLKNTYGVVNMDYRGQKINTGMQFVGCIMGDYAKSAINTGIFTGKTIGACSMLYGFVTTNVPSFVNYARLFGQVTELPPEVMIASQQRMFQRRNVQQRDCDVQLIHDMYELTRDERQLAGEPLSL
ncbi:MAG: putative sugar nucleotidyl transferase [Pirellulaceae bacterium]